LHIHLIWSASAAKMPAAMRATIEYAARFYDRWFTDPIKVNIAVGFNEIDRQHLDADEGGEGRFNYIQSSYSALEPTLAAQDGGAALPASDPTGGAGVCVSNAEAKALGLLPADQAGVDGYVGFRYERYYAMDPHDRAVPGKEDFTGICLHELSEALGRRTDPDEGTAANPGGGVTPLDLFRYAASGELATDASKKAYFSTNLGATDICNFNTQPSGDFGDWRYPGAGPDAYRGGITDGVLSPITESDVELMAALGFTEGKLPKPLSSTITVIADSPDEVFIAHNAWGWSDNYHFYGEGGDDRFIGGTGNDVMVGGDGCNSLFNGGAGVNYYFGSQGDGPGSETGHNTFVLKRKPHKMTEDFVQDWTQGHSVVKIVDTSLTSFSDLLAHSYQHGAYFVVQPDADNSIWLKGATAETVRAADFRFVG
jgi:hypothetical protein